MVTRLSEMNLPRFPLLSEEEAFALLRRAKEGDQEARERLINCNLKLVFNLVQRFENRGYDLEDLFQVGTIGLIKAIDKFDFSYEVKFSTYAVPMIIGEIRRFLRDDNSLRVSRSLRETAYRVARAREELAMAMGHEPSIGEVAQELELKREEVVAALEAVQPLESIYDTIYQDEGDPILVVDQLVSQDNEEQAFNRTLLRQLLKRLPEKQRRVLLLRFFADCTQSEVAEMIGLSQVQVSRLERQAFAGIRALLDEATPERPTGREEAPEQAAPPEEQQP